jgi:hypothetical protein
MQLYASIATSEPNGKTFRMDFGIVIPLFLFVMIFAALGVL